MNSDRLSRELQTEPAHDCATAQPVPAASRLLGCDDDLTAAVEPSSLSPRGRRRTSSTTVRTGGIRGDHNALAERLERSKYGW